MPLLSALAPRASWLNKHTAASALNAREQQRPCRLAAAATNTMAVADSPLLFSFGVISDVQYADIPDGKSFHGVPRYYRAALESTQRAVAEGWVPAGAQFGMHLGDILDGFCEKDKSEEMLQRLIDAFDQLQRPTYHIVANHCLYNLSRSRLHQMLDIPHAPDGASYYSFSPHPAWRVVVIDAYDVSVLGWDADHPRHQEAAAILARENPNENKNSPEGLVGLQRRYVQFGGGCSDQQLEWLDQQLQEAEQQEQCVIVSSHLPIYPDTCPPACLVWNYDQVLDILQKRPGVVVATLAGHSHQNGYKVDAAGIHHMVLPGVVEAPPGRDCYGIVEVYSDRLLLKGVDICMSCNCKLTAAAVDRQGRAAAAVRQQQQQEQPASVAVAGRSAGAASNAGDGSDAVVDVSDEAAMSKLAEGVAGIDLVAVAGGASK